MVREEIIDRIVCAKYMFENGTQILDRGAPYAAGMTVLTFQDSVEMTLRAIAEHIHAQIRENSAFHNILDEIDKVGVAQLTHRTALNQLNKARVGFKHMGLAPRDEDVRKFRRDLEGFFPNAVSSFLGVDFDRLSLASLIRHKRTRNWLEKAELELTNNSFYSSITCAAVAEAIHTRSNPRGQLDLNRNRTMNFRGTVRQLGTHRELHDLVAEIDKQLLNIYEEIDLVGSGTPYGDYLRFRDLSPVISLTMAGTLIIESRSDPENVTHEDALFCKSFALNTILKRQQSYRSKVTAPESSMIKYKTIKPSDVIVYPTKDGIPQEVIERVDTGCVLHGCQKDDGVSPYVAVDFQGDTAYAIRDALELIIE